MPEVSRFVSWRRDRRRKPVFQSFSLPLMLGVFASGEKYRKALTGPHLDASCMARTLLSQPTFVCAQEVERLTLVALSVGELCQSSEAPYVEIRERALKRGHLLCVPEAGPALTYQHRTKKSHKRWHIGMEAITDGIGREHIFAVGREGSREVLSCAAAQPLALYAEDDVFLFLHRQ
jgi:hypothetical protein